MGILGTLTDREYNKFILDLNENPAVRTFNVNKLIPDEFDTIILGYTGSDVTSIEYRIGGVSGTIVATLTLNYSGGNLVSVSKS